MPFESVARCLEYRRSFAVELLGHPMAQVVVQTVGGPEGWIVNGVFERLVDHVGDLLDMLVDSMVDQLSNGAQPGTAILYQAAFQNEIPL